jgi:hypothetical protein
MADVERAVGLLVTQRERPQEEPSGGPGIVPEKTVEEIHNQSSYAQRPGCNLQRANACNQVHTLLGGAF